MEQHRDVPQSLRGTRAAPASLDLVVDHEQNVVGGLLDSDIGDQAVLVVEDSPLIRRRADAHVDIGHLSCY